MVLSTFAGPVGMLLGNGAALTISSTLNCPTLISPTSIGIGFLIASGVGVFFGFYPALRASRLGPIEASA